MRTSMRKARDAEDQVVEQQCLMKWSEIGSDYLRSTAV